MSEGVYLMIATYAVCVIALIGGVASIYFIVHIWAYRKHKFIRSRIPPLTRNVLWIFFSLLLLCIVNALVYNLLHVWKVTYFFIIHDAIQYGCTFAYATRAWILFYHVEWSYESINHVWRTQLAQVEHVLDRSDVVDKESIQSEIEKNKLIQHSQFYITYRNTLGNYKKVFPLMMLLLLPLFIFLLDILPLIILDFEAPYTKVHNILFRSIHIFCFLVIILIILNLVHRIGQISDKYGIGKELKRINICFGFFILLGRVGEILIIITSSNIHYVEFVASTCSILSILCALYISSFFVLRRLFSEFLTPDTLRKMDENDANKRIYNIVTMCMNVQLQREKTQSKMEGCRLTLNEVLSSKIGFETFTQFLISELSVENILFLVEVKQYKACCRRYHKQEHGASPTQIAASSSNSTNFNTLRSSTTTQSKPNVFNSHSVMNVEYIPRNELLQSLDPYDYSLYLLHKYVVNGSDLQINIPFKTRRKLIDFMAEDKMMEVKLLDDYTDQMFLLYDKAWEQINSLIKTDSFLRFKYTKEYQDVCRQHQEQQRRDQDKDSGGGTPLVLKPVLSILDWPSTEEAGAAERGHVAVRSGTIPEDQELSKSKIDDDDDDMEKLNSIQHYDTERTAEVKKQLSDGVFAIDEDEAMDILEAMDDCDFQSDSD